MKRHGETRVTFFEDRVRSMGRVCLHEMPHWSVVIVRWNSNAAGVHDQRAPCKLNQSRDVRVSAQNQRLPDGAEKFHNGVVGPNYWASRTYVFEKISRVTRWCTVTEEHHAVYHGSSR
jgi:hypothetical protein